MGIRRSKAGRVDPGQAPPRVEAASVLSIVDACQDRTCLRTGSRVELGELVCIPSRHVRIAARRGRARAFQRCTGRSAPSPGGYLEASLICGRRGGKSLILGVDRGLLGLFFRLGAVSDSRRARERCHHCCRSQTGNCHFQIHPRVLFCPAAQGMIDRLTADTIDLNNGVTIEIQTASFRTIRGRSICAALCDELSFWRMSDDNSANPETEIIAASPAMATIPKAMLLKASSPYARRGALWNDYRRHFGKDDSSMLVWQADTMTMNPSVPQSIIDAAYEDDPANAAAEYGAQFRSDIEAFVTRALEACVIDGRFELPPMAKIAYSAFVDPSGGSNDSYVFGNLPS